MGAVGRWLAFVCVCLPWWCARADVQRIVARGTLRCGIDQTEAEYTTTEDHGPRVAFDRALCSAVAVALLGPGAKVTLTAYPDETAAIGALRSGEVDLVPTLSADLTRTTDPTIAVTAPVLHDAVTFLVPLAAKVDTAKDLAGRKVCFLAETETEVALQDWGGARHVAYVPFPFQEQGEMEAAFVTNNCTALAGDATRMGGVRASLGSHAAAYRVLPDTLRDDPLATAVRASDSALARIAQWTWNVLLLAEEAGVTAANAATYPTGQSAAADRLLGRTHELGRPFGLREQWAREVLEAVGNAGELFDRALGEGSPMGIPRGLNALPAAGGVMTSLPIK